MSGPDDSDEQPVRTTHWDIPNIQSRSGSFDSDERNNCAGYKNDTCDNSVPSRVEPEACGWSHTQRSFCISMINSSGMIY